MNSEPLSSVRTTPRSLNNIFDIIAQRLQEKQLLIPKIPLKIVHTFKKKEIACHLQVNLLKISFFVRESAFP